jgi:hypothetical protein
MVERQRPPVPPVAHTPIYPHHRHTGINRVGPFTQTIVPPVAHTPIYPHHRHTGITIRVRPFTQTIVQPIVQTGPYTAPLRPVVRKNPLERYKTIKKADFDAPCADSCPICLEIHTKGDSLTTECDHKFGKDCYNFWMNSLSSNKKCPTCRKDCPKVTYYKTRKTKPIPLIIEDNDSETEVSVF